MRKVDSIVCAWLGGRSRELGVAGGGLGAGQRCRAPLPPTRAPSGQPAALPPGLGDDHLGAQLVELVPQLLGLQRHLGVVLHLVLGLQALKRAQMSGGRRRAECRDVQPRLGRRRRRSRRRRRRRRGGGMCPGLGRVLPGAFGVFLLLACSCSVWPGVCSCVSWGCK